MSEIDEEQGWDAVEDARPVRRYFDQEGMPGHVIGHEYGQGGPAFPAPDADDVRATVAAIASLAAWTANEMIDWSSAEDLRVVLESADELVALAASCQRALRERLAALDAVRLADGAEGQS